MDTALLDRIDAIAAAYRARLHDVVARSWPSRPLARHAVALYFEAQVPDQERIDIAGGWVVSERIRDLLHAFQAIDAALPAGEPPHTLTFGLAPLGPARTVLALAGEARLFRELRELALLGLIEAVADRDGLCFADPSGVMQGSLLHAADDYIEGYDSAHVLSPDTLNRRYEALDRIAARERGEAQLLAAAAVLAMREALPPPRGKGAAAWAHPHDAIRSIFGPQQAYRESLRIESDVFLARSRRSWPPVGGDARLGPVSWHEITAVFALLQALATHHHRLGRALLGSALGPRSAVFVPALQPALTPTRQFAPAMGEYLVDTSTDAVVDLAADFCGVSRAAAAAIIDSCILRRLPADRTVLHGGVYSGLVEIGPGRLLLVPTLGLNAADPDSLLRLAQALAPLQYNAVVGAALGQAPLRFAEELRQEPALTVVVDRKLLRPNGQRLSDIDLGIYDRRDGVLVLAEFKSFWLQDADSLRSIDQRLQEAAGQLDGIVAHLQAGGAAGLAAVLGVEVPDMPALLPLIVTRRHYGFASGIRHPVLPQPALHRLLQRSEGRMARFRDLLADITPSAALATQSWHRAEIAGLRWRSPAGTAAPGLFDTR